MATPADRAWKRKWASTVVNGVTNRYAERLKADYKLTVDEFHRLVVGQQGRCAICFAQMPEPCVDHCHRTGEVRGLLCPRCNKGLGLLGDTAEAVRAALNYLEK